MATIQKHTCHKCKKNINLRTQKYIICEGICKKVWHVPKCIEVSEEQHAEITRNVEISWFCDPCKDKRRQRRSVMYEPNTNTPSSPAISNTNQLNIDVGTAITTVQGNQVTLELIYREIKSIREEQANYQRKMDGLKTVIDDCKAIIENITQENIELRNEIDILHNKINNVDHTIDTQDQHGLDHNLVFNGVTEFTNENTTQAIMQIATALKVSIEEEHIKTAVRKTTTSTDSGFPRSIIVTFRNKEKRDEILATKRTQITTQCLGQIDGEQYRPIYVAEQLTARKQYLFKMARDIKRAQFIKFAWARNGEIFIRKTENSRIIKIKHSDQLKQLQNANN